MKLIKEDLKKNKRSINEDDSERIPETNDRDPH